MILKYRGTALPDNENWFQIIKRWHRAQTGITTHRTERWNITGVIVAASQSALETQIDSREALFKSGSGDLIWYQSDGTTETEHKITENETLNGIRIVDFTWSDGLPGQWGAGPEYTFVRTYRVSLQADVLDSDGEIVFWSQTIEQIGTGGRDFSVQESLNSFPIVQFTNFATQFRARQHGMAIGLNGTPAAPGAIWPGSLDPRLSRVSSTTPQIIGAIKSIYWPIKWDYHFKAGTGLSAVVPPLFV